MVDGFSTLQSPGAILWTAATNERVLYATQKVKGLRAGQRRGEGARGWVAKGGRVETDTYKLYSTHHVSE